MSQSRRQSAHAASVGFEWLRQHPDIKLTYTTSEGGGIISASAEFNRLREVVSKISPRGFEGLMRTIHHNPENIGRKVDYEPADNRGRHVTISPL